MVSLYAINSLCLLAHVCVVVFYHTTKETLICERNMLLYIINVIYFHIMTPRVQFEERENHDAQDQDSTIDSKNGASLKLGSGGR